LAWSRSFIRSFNTLIKWRAHQYTISGLTIKKEDTTPSCQATMPRGPGTTPLRRARCPAVLSTAAVPVAASKVSPWTLGRSAAHLAVQQRSHRPDFATDLLSDYSQHRCDGPSDVHRIQFNNFTAIHTITTVRLDDVNKWYYLCYTVGVITNNPAVSHISFKFSPNIYRVAQEEWTKLREGVPYVKLYRYNPKHLYQKLNGYGDNGQRKVSTSCIST